ncbi:MAG: patatin-like phospholipase family protein [Eubacteriales bacterium]|nr:patatin-like phospholipase family protein [Eubacteriales bacterium]
MNHMKPLDLTKEYGIVLEGGGARGSYQVGVWKALEEGGVRIKGISGVSVGALNGALMCQKDLKKAERLWSSISYAKVLKGNEAYLSSLADVRGKNALQVMRTVLGSGDLKLLIDGTKELLEQGGFDITPLKKLIAAYIDPLKIKQSDRSFSLVTFSVEEKKEITVDVNALLPEETADMLLASSFLPVFRQELLGGKKYLDGGVFNKVPTDVLVRKGYQDIIVIRIYGVGLNRPMLPPRGVNIYEIAPEDDLGGVLEFDKTRAVQNMRLGYFDGLRLLKGLCGKRYYFDCDPAEALIYQFDELERLAEALSIERFRIYKPQQLLKKIRQKDAERVKAGVESVFCEKPPETILQKLFSPRHT